MWLTQKWRFTTAFVSNYSEKGKEKQIAKKRTKFIEQDSKRDLSIAIPASYQWTVLHSLRNIAVEIKTNIREDNSFSKKENCELFK